MYKLDERVAVFLGELIEGSKWAVVLFDQANTNNEIKRLGSRGEKLASAIEDLRKLLKESGTDPYDVRVIGQ